MSLPRFGVSKPVPVNLLMIAMIIGGLYAAATLTREFFPETTPESASVTLPYPGATPEEIEANLARKVEDKIADLDEVDEIRTTIAEGGGGITVEFREGIDDIDKAVDEVERVVDSLTDLPDEAERLQVTEFEPTLPVIMVSMFGEDVDEEVLKRGIRQIRDDLETLPGMGDVVISGTRNYEIRVDVSRDELLEQGIALPDVAAAIRAWMADVPGGTVRTESGNFNIRTLGVEESAEAIRDIVIRATPEGQAVRVGDIADVREYYVDQQIRTRFLTRPDPRIEEYLSGPSASLTVYRVGDQDAVEIAEMVRAYVQGRRVAAGRVDDPYDPTWLDRLYAVLNTMTQQGPPENRPPRLRTNQRVAYELGATTNAPMPVGADIAMHSDLAVFIEGRLDLLLRNAKWGAVLVFATLLAFLNWRVAFWVGVGLFTALSGTLMLMSAAGVTLNLLTMFGLIVVLGLLVDDAIVVAENIQARHDRGESSLVAAVKGTEEVFWPVVATVLTSIVAFLPLTFIRGSIGDLLGALPWVVACALSMSLVESVLIMPSHMAHSLVHRDKSEPGWFGRFMRKLERARDNVIDNRIVPAYSKLLRKSLHFRYVSLFAALAALIMSIGMLAGGRAVFTFLPSSDSETLIIDLRMPIGTPIQRTEDVVQRIENAAAAQPEMRTVSAMIGVRTSLDEMQGASTGGSGTHLAQVFVELLPVEQRVGGQGRQSSQIIAAIREDLGRLDGVESLKFSEIQGGPGGTDITVEISGDDPAALEVVTGHVKAMLDEFAGVFDIADNNDLGQREIRIVLKPSAAALGFTQQNVGMQVRAALFGIDAHVFSADREDIDVRVRLEESTRESLYAIENLWLVNPMGERVPLSEIADLREGTSYSTIRRIDRKRTITVTADTAPDVNPEDITPQLQQTFVDLEAEFPGVEIEMGGRQRQMARAFASLPIGFLAAMIMIYVILAWLFSSFTQPIAVMLGVPFALVGVIWGHLLLGYELTFLSLIGFVALSGIVVNDSLILVQFYNDRRAEGSSITQALVEAGQRRLRPIFLTTVTTVLGLTPLMLETSFQAKFLIPMAISISFGLISATVLILLVLPCILLILDDFKRSAYYLWHGLPRPEPSADIRAAIDDLGG